MEPRVSVEVGEVYPHADAGRWRVSWRVRNQAAEPLELQSAWIPHGRFRGEGRLPLSVTLAEGQATSLEFTVSASESPATTVENAFLILRVKSAGAAWQIFTRMHVEFDTDGTPQPVIEAITSQSLG